MTAAVAGISRDATLWGTGAATSALFHVALIGFLALAIAPAPPPPSPDIESRLDMAPLDVPASTARETRAEGEPAGEVGAAGDVIGVGAVRTERARPAAPPSQPLAAAASETRLLVPAGAGGAPIAPLAAETPELTARPPSGEVVRGAAPAAAAVAAAEPPDAAKTPAAAPRAERVASALAAATALDATAPQAAVVAAVADALPAVPAAAAPAPGLAPAALAAPTVAAAAPAAARAGAAEPRAETVAARAPPPAPATAAARPQAPLAAPATADARAAPTVAAPAPQLASRPAAALAQAAGAALAWAGGADAALDPTSLAAIQSFMAPKSAREAAGGEPSARDVIGEALAQARCSRVAAAFVPASGGIELRGHVPDRDMRRAIVERISATVGGSIPVGGNLLVLPEPQCEVLGALDRLGLPQSEDLSDDPLTVGRAAEAGIRSYADGDRLTLELQAPDYDAYVYVDYYDSDGAVLHLTPNRFAPLKRRPAGAEVRLEAIGEAGMEMRIGPPFGRDIAVALALTAPLGGAPRPLVEDARTYLDWLADRLAAVRAGHADLRGEWFYLLIETHPQGGSRPNAD